MTPGWVGFLAGAFVWVPAGVVIMGWFASGRIEDAYVRGVRDGRAWRTRMISQHLSQRRTN